MSRKTAVVTGASRGIGLAIARRLLAAGWQVFGLSRSEGPVEEIPWIPCDVSVPESVNQALESACMQAGRLDLLVCNAGMGISGAVEFTSEEDAELQIDVNLMGAVRCARKAASVMRKQGFGKIIFISSLAAIFPLPFQSLYSASKAGSDMLVKAYMDTYHFPANITNCSNNYGPYQFPEKLIPLIINNALHGRKLPVYGDGKNVRDWLFVEDHAKAIDMVQEKGRLFETYNVGGHNEKQNIEIIHIILDTLREMLPDSDPRKALVSDDLITYVEDRKGHDRRYAIAPDKIRAEIGWEPETMFAEGIKKTIKWYFEHEDWMKNVTSGDYQKYYEEMYHTGK